MLSKSAYKCFGFMTEKESTIEKTTNEAVMDLMCLCLSLY